MDHDQRHHHNRAEKAIKVADFSTLTFPASIMGHVWSPSDPHGMERSIPVVDRHGHSWDFTGRLRIDRQGRKPGISGDAWRDFLRVKGLNVSDKLIFYRNPMEFEALFVVTVRRQKIIRLGGTDILAYEMED